MLTFTLKHFYKPTKTYKFLVAIMYIFSYMFFISWFIGGMFFVGLDLTK